jgi:hypothetical protein
VSILAHLFYWIEVHTGTVNESGPYYGFWSGFGSDIGEVVLIGGVVAVVRHHTCAHRPCRRLSRHVTKDGHKLCRTHLKLPASELDLPDVHPDHA